MATARQLDPISSIWDLIAVELRRQRTERRLSLAAIGSIIQRDRSLVSLVESGEVRLQAAHAEALDAEWTTGGLFGALVHHAKTRHETSWVEARTELENKATHLGIWALAWIPGFFQTGEYARASFVASGLEDVEAAVRARLSRADILNRRPRPLVRAILDQGTIDQPVGGAETMYGQLSHLLKLAEIHTIRVVPKSVGAHVGRDGPFQIMTSDREADVVYTQALGPGRLIQDTSEVGLYRVWFDRISDVALPKGDSLRLIRETMEGFQ